MSKRAQREAPRCRRKKESVAAMATKTIRAAMGKGEKRSLRKPGNRSRSFAPKSLQLYDETDGVTGEEVVASEIFFDVPVGSSAYSKPLVPMAPSSEKLYSRPPSRGRHDTPDGDNYGVPKRKSGTDIRKAQVAPQQSVPREKSWSLSSRQRTAAPTVTKPSESKGPYRSWDKDGDDVPDFLEDMFDNSDRHAVGMNILEKIFGEVKDPEAKRDNRPYFTYWVSILQLIVYIVAVATYGFAPIGLSKTKIEKTVLMPNLAYEKVFYYEPDNLWIGPRQDDLIHMGAKYSPCIRNDSAMVTVTAIDNALEKNMACCVYNDGSGCFLSQAQDCIGALATWNKWTTNNTGYQNRTSGSVCGLDPEYCETPASIGSEVWVDDVSKWPKCKKALNVTSTPNAGNRHMTCDLVGRPCCIGIQGECILTTREFCNFRRGYFHDTAFLCSQVSCIGEVCGMIPFLQTNEPDQFYRLLTSLFLHSGILSLLITLAFQLIFQRDLEKTIGWWRMAMIYMLGGVFGSLGSAIFIPYYVEAGPSGSQFAVLGAFAVEVVRWNIDESDDKIGPAIGKLFGFVMVLFLFGAVLPQVDNWAHLFGFLIGIVMSIAARPFEKYHDRVIKGGYKAATVIVCLVLFGGVVVALCLLYWVYPDKVRECTSCMYFNCIPFSATYCDGMSVTIGRNVTV